MVSLLLASLFLSTSQSFPSVPFELNVGAQPDEVAFHAPLASGSVFVTRAGELVYAFASEHSAGASLVERWVAAEAAPVGVAETPTLVHRFQGDDPSTWREGIPTFERVELGELWPGVRVSLRAGANNVEKLFELAPHADVARLRLELRGACALEIADDGTLVARTTAGEVRFTAPIAWQVHDGVREPVDVRYSVSGCQYGFALGAYDPSRELWIDPLLQSTFLGGSGQERIDDMAFDAASNSVYVAGETTSVNFPGTAGGALPAQAGANDAFVARLSSTLTTLQAATYFGGVNDDRATGIALGAGTVYICGSTNSSALPGSAAGAIPARTGAADGFVARLSANLSVVHAASFFGGAEPFPYDRANDIAFDALASQAVIVGETSATNLPGTIGSAEPASHGGTEAYVARFSSSLAALVTATYVGGNQNDYGNSVVVQAGTGHAFVAGMTDSTDLPAALGGIGGAQNAYLGCGFCSAGFVARVNPGLTFVESVSYYTFPGLVWFEDLAQASDGTLYAVGPIGPYTGPNLPPGVSTGAQPFPGGEDDSIVVRFAGDLAVVFGASFVGGSKSEWGHSVAIDPANGEVLVAGTSTSWNIPGSQGGAQSLPFVTPTGVDDTYVTRLSHSLNGILQSTYLGGTFREVPRALVATAQQVLVAGYTGSANLPGRIGGAQATIGGFDDGFVARFDSTLTGAPPAPGNYCVSGTSINGCKATISASANPSATFAGPCTIQVTNVEGQRTGAIFYSTMGRAGTPWCPFGGSSYLCMLLPLQRTTPQNSGGTSLACDGTFTLSWNAWHAANPGAPGNFITAGTEIDLQCWYRDPGNCRQTSLSNAVEVTMLP